jgi:hypothetical protein
LIVAAANDSVTLDRRLQANPLTISESIDDSGRGVRDGIKGSIGRVSIPHPRGSGIREAAKRDPAAPYHFIGGEDCEPGTL